MQSVGHFCQWMGVVKKEVRVAMIGSVNPLTGVQ